MHILGLSCFYHDAAAALVRDGEIMAAAQSEAEATRDRAIGEIERARDQALKELFDQVSTQVAAATEHVLGRSLDAADQQRLIGEALAEMTSESN